MLSLQFLLTSLVIVAAPGTGVLYTLAAGLARGRRAAVVAAFGCTLGIVPHLLAAMLGLAALLHQSALLFQSLKIAGVAYLLYMAWGALREKGTLAIKAELDEKGAREVIATAILVNVLNPKLSIFFLAFLPQFIDAKESAPLTRMLDLSGVFMLMTFAVFVCYGLCAAGFRQQIAARPRVVAWMRRTFAGVFVLMGAKLALSER